LTSTDLVGSGAGAKKPVIPDRPRIDPGTAARILTAVEISQPAARIRAGTPIKQPVTDLIVAGSAASIQRELPGQGDGLTLRIERDSRADWRVGIQSLISGWGAAAGIVGRACGVGAGESKVCVETVRSIGPIARIVGRGDLRLGKWAASNDYKYRQQPRPDKLRGFASGK